MEEIKRQWRHKLFEIISIIIAFMALIVTVGTQMAVDYSSKKPLLQIELLKLDDEKDKGFKVTNVGYGPAVIKSFKYYKNEKDFKNEKSYSDWFLNGKSVALNLEAIGWSANTLEEGYILSNDKDLFLLKTNSLIKSPSITEKSLGDAIIVIEYKSLSPFDWGAHYLKYCERFKRNNIRKRNLKNIYES